MPSILRVLTCKVTGGKPTHTLFFDRSVGKKIPESLRLVRLPITVKYHDECFAQDAADDAWLPIVGTETWTVIGQDKSYHRRSSEKLAIVKYNVGVFYLWGAQARSWEQLRCFMNAYEDIVAILNSVARPFLYRIDRYGKLMNITDRLR